MKKMVFISSELPFVSNKQSNRFTIMVICLMVDFRKILPYNLTRIWFGVLFWILPNDPYEFGDVARNDVTCSNLRITCLVITTSSNALCHSSRNLVTNCDSNRKKKNMNLCVLTWDALSLCSKDNLSLAQISWDVLKASGNWIWWPPQWKIKLKYAFKSLDFRVAWITKLATLKLRLVPSTTPQRSNWFKEHFNIFDQMEFFWLLSLSI